MSDVESFELVIPGPPRGKGRPRFNAQAIDGKVRRKTYTDAQTRREEERIQTLWMAAGRPRLPEAALSLRLAVYLPRPLAHYGRHGLRESAHLCVDATKKPDADNVWKLVADALSGLAWTDDRFIVEATVIKRLEEDRGMARVEIKAWLA